ncbi:MAGE-domain-containing protein [Lentithecium fluviatile CBS 122367]|uniref:MAGE-domain-containing protein n=1 Tax=Lentithecium fluviatile CBS 122367 TaxID=1168545 RepID=A0A6G1IQ92_9PLEO|nr:MAGE-domain-containing protein [Lentithecium fluviatile CBS 122367]
MPPASRKRRAPTDDDASTPTLTQSRRNRWLEEPPEEEDELDKEEEEEAETDHGSGSIAQLSKNLVRYALACEYKRIPIKRPDVGQKVLGTHARMFKAVFEAANSQLMDVFGMQMVELPNKEKVTIRQKRAAASSDAQSKSSGMWVLRNILPEQYRMADVIGPGPDPPEGVLDDDGAYVGLYTMIISLILLSGGQLAESKLDRYLRRMNAEQSTPVDTKEKLLARIIKDGYIIKVKDNSSGEEMVDYMVGPRGKVEVDKQSVAAFVRTVYGPGVEDLEQRLSRSLGLEEGEVATPNGEAAAAGQDAVRWPGRPRRRGSEDD